MYQWELGRGSSLEVARTAVVNMLVLSEVFYLFNVRQFTGSALRLVPLPATGWRFAAVAITLVLQVAFTYAAPMQQLFGSAALDLASWAWIVALATVRLWSSNWRSRCFGASGCAACECPRGGAGLSPRRGRCRTRLLAHSMALPCARLFRSFGGRGSRRCRRAFSPSHDRPFLHCC
ncbi:MAG: cation transporting ATPase C-terminal domain-containing protein [Burkholderiaceae bacterium]